MIVPNFWVPQYGTIPSTSILVYLTVILVSMATITLIFYYHCNRIVKISKEVAGKVQQNEIVDLSWGLFSFYVGTLLVIINSIISLTSVILTNGSKGIYMVGYQSYLSEIGMILFQFGLIIIFLHINRYLGVDMGKVQLFGVIVGATPLIFIGLVGLSITETFTLIVLGEIVFVMILLLLFVIIGGMYLFWRYYYDILDDVKKMRIILLYCIFILFIGTLIFQLPLLPSGSEQTWLTRNTEVFLWIFLTPTLVFFQAMLLYFIFVVPTVIRKIFNIDLIDFQYQMDDQFDSAKFLFSTYPAPPQLNQETINEQPPDVTNDDDYIILTSYSEDKRSTQWKDLIDHLSKIFGSKAIFDIKMIDDPYFKESVIFNNHFLIIGNCHSTYLDKIFNLYGEMYEETINWRDGEMEIDGFQYKHKSWEFAFLFALNSLWSYNQNVWMIFAPPHLHEQIRDFFDQYFSFFNSYSENESIFCTLKFPVEGNQILDIPPAQDEINKPDFDYISFRNPS